MMSRPHCAVVAAESYARPGPARRAGSGPALDHFWMPHPRAVGPTGTRNWNTGRVNDIWGSQALFLGLSSPNYESGCYHTLRITGRHKDTRCAETDARS